MTPQLDVVGGDAMGEPPIGCAAVSGCRNNSRRRHATAHWHQTHPVIRSFEPGKAWSAATPTSSCSRPAERQARDRASVTSGAASRAQWKHWPGAASGTGAVSRSPTAESTAAAQQHPPATKTAVRKPDASAWGCR